MWTEPHPTFHGEHFAIDDAAASPRPDVVPPICIGAQGEQVALPVVGRCADMWNIFYPGDEDWKRKRAIVDAAAEAAGRDPAAIASCVTIAGELPDSDAASEQWADRVRDLVDARHRARRVRLRPPARSRAGSALRRAGDRPAPRPDRRSLAAQIMKPMRSITTCVGLEPPRILMLPLPSTAVITPLAMF